MRLLQFLIALICLFSGCNNNNSNRISFYNKNLNVINKIVSVYDSATRKERFYIHIDYGFFSDEVRVGNHDFESYYGDASLKQFIEAKGIDKKRIGQLIDLMKGIKCVQIDIYEYDCIEHLKNCKYKNIIITTDYNATMTGTIYYGYEFWLNEKPENGMNYVNTYKNVTLYKVKIP